MKKIKLYFFVVFLLLLCTQATGHAETMYVTDRLYLSLRNAPDPEQRHLALLPSDTKVDVLETEGDWAKVMLEDGRTGWVMKRFLDTNVPKTFLIKQLKGEIANLNMLVESLREENVSLKKESDTLNTKIATLKSRIIQQNKHVKKTGTENAITRVKEIYASGVVGLLGGYL